MRCMGKKKGERTEPESHVRDAKPDFV